MRYAQKQTVLAQDAANALVKSSAALQHTVRETDAYHRVTLRPVPQSFSGQAFEQRLMALKQVFEGVQQQTFAKTARAAQKIIFALFHQINSHAGFVHIIVTALTDL